MEGFQYAHRKNCSVRAQSGSKMPKFDSSQFFESIYHLIYNQLLSTSMSTFQKLQSYSLHLRYKLNNLPLVRGISKRISNISFIFRLESSKLYVSELPRATRLLKIAKSLDISLTWDIFMTFLRSNSELDQEFVAYLICREHNFFVEFGALDGLIATNTLILEKKYGWNGILAEANPDQAEFCSINRTNPVFPGAIIGKHNLPPDSYSINKPLLGINTHNLWADSVLEVYSKKCRISSADFLRGNKSALGLSSLLEFALQDRHSKDRLEQSELIQVACITLEDFLRIYSAPEEIGYLSMDTEGSELATLLDFPFAKYVFNFISIEHNNSASKDHIIKLLEQNGYRVILPEFSGGESWFVHKDRFKSQNSQ